MQVSKEGIEAIKSANELAAVVAERGIEVTKKGKVYVARCPFHEEKTASFTITPGKGLFHCFGCKKAGDVIGFVTHHDKIGFPDAVKKLAARAGLDVDKLMEHRPRQVVITGPVVDSETAAKTTPEPPAVNTAAILGQVVEHYHRTFCERADAQDYMRKRGFVDADILKAFKVGYADGSLLKRIGKGEVKDALLSLGVITDEGRELMGGCVVVPIPDPVTGQWTTMYGRGMRTPRHCYLTGSLRGVLNYQAARASSEVILAESILDALSFHQAGVFTAIPLYGTNGFTPDHMDLLTRERIKRVILALDGDAAGRKATAALKEKLTAAGIDVCVMPYPPNVKDPNELLVSCNGNASDVFRKCLDEAEPRPAPTSAAPVAKAEATDSDGRVSLSRDDRAYTARVLPVMPGRLRATVRADKGALFHVDTIDLYASRSRAEFAKRAAKALGADVEHVEADLLALLLEAEKLTEQKSEPAIGEARPAPITESERAEALSLLKRPDLLDQIARDVDALGYVGEETNKRLLYLVAVSRKLADPLSAIVLSQSGAGKSGITEVIERLTPPEDAVLITRLTPQSLYYVEPGFLDQKLVIIEERYGSMEADYSIRVLQSRKKLIAAAPIKDPQTGNMKTKTFTVEARAAFIEATTAGNVNHENATRCFELSMDESAEQTRRIHERQRLAKTEAGLRMREEAEAIKRRHWNAQRLLEPLPVIIPYADRLTFPSAWMRTRRDHARFLNLIEVSAFLHQHQRERRFGAVVASVADYAVAYGLAASILADTLSDLRRALRDAYAAIQALAAERGGIVSRREIREALALPDGTVRHWLAELVELEYLRTETGGQGKAARYALTEKGPQKDLVLGLLTPDELRRLIP